MDKARRVWPSRGNVHSSNQNGGGWRGELIETRCIAMSDIAR